MKTVIGEWFSGFGSRSACKTAERSQTPKISTLGHTTRHSPNSKVKAVDVHFRKYERRAEQNVVALNLDVAHPAGLHAPITFPQRPLFQTVGSLDRQVA